MIKDIKELKAKHNYVSDIDVVYGNHRGFFFTLNNLERKNMLCLVFSVNANDSIVEQVSNLRRTYYAIPMGGVYKEGTEINIELNLLNLNNSDDLEEILNAIVSIFKMNTLINICSESKSQDNIGIYRVGTKVKILSQSIFENQKQSVRSNYKSKAPKNMALAWISFFAVLLVMVLIKNLIGNVIFFIPMAIAAGGLRIGVELFERYSGPIHKKDALIIIAMFIIMLLLAPIINLVVRMVLLGIGPIESIKGAFAIVFADVEAFISMYRDIPFSIAISIYACWGQIQQILGKAQRGKRVSRKNNKLL